MEPNQAQTEVIPQINSTTPSSPHTSFRKVPLLSFLLFIIGATSVYYFYFIASKEKEGVFIPSNEGVQANMDIDSIQDTPFKENKNSVQDFTFTATPTSGQSPLKVRFNGTISTPANYDGNAILFFGDGVSDVMLRSDQESFNENWEYTYKKPGTYEAMLIITSMNNVDADIEVMRNPFYTKNQILKKIQIVVGD